MITSRATWLVAGALVFAAPALAQVPDPEFAKMAQRAAASDSAIAMPATLAPIAPQSIVQPYGTWRMQPPPVLFGASMVLDPVHNRIVAACGSNGYLQKDVWTLSLVPGSTWQIDSLASAQSPGPLAYAATVYDPAHARLVMFGGLGYPATPLNQVWALSLGDPMVWSPVPAQGIPPPPRWNAVAAYDSRRNRLIIYGGEDGHSYKSDAWALSLGDTATWERLEPADSIPVAKSEAAGVYDSIKDRLLVFGGLYLNERGNARVSHDLLQLSLGDTVAWRTIAASEYPPYGAISSAAFFDPVANRMLLFGGRTNGEGSWALNLNGAPTWDGSAIPNEPLFRERFTALYDSERGRLLIAGGSESALDESGVDVLPLSTSPEWSSLGLHPHPPGRSDAITFFDSRRDRMIIFGGDVAGPGNDTWALSLSNLGSWTRLSSTKAPRLASPLTTGAYDSRGDRCFLLTRTGNYRIGYRNTVLVLPLADTSATWQEFPTTGDAPPPHFNATAIYDPVRNRLLFFGGRTIDYTDFDDTQSNKVWALSLDGTPRWTKIDALGPAPSPREGSWAFYDGANDRLLIHGGYSDQHYPENDFSVPWWPAESAGDDWWALSLGGQPTWKKLLPQGSGPSLSGASIAYDSAHHRMLVTGGRAGFLSQYNTSTWGLNLEPELRWEYLLTSGDPATGRSNASSIYDPVGDRLVVFGGNGLINRKNDIWSLEFSNGATPAAWIVRSTVESGAVQLVWGMRDGVGTTATVYRKTDSTPWAAMTNLQADAAGELSFTDTPPADHWRETYRIGVTQGGVTTYSPPVDVQLQQTRQPLLVGSYPNPSRAGDFQVRFQLPSPAVARLEMIDVRGRVVWAGDVTASTPGIETFRLPAQKRSGVYLLKLLQNGNSATLKAVVLE